MRSFVFYYTICFVFCQVFVTCFLKKVLLFFFVVVVMFDTPLCSHRFCRVARVLYVWGRVGFLLGLRAWVFVFRRPSVACAGVYVVVGVFVSGGVCSSVRGAARRVMWIMLGLV